MNKKAWLEAALALIDTMPREEFLSALEKCGAMDKSSETAEVAQELTYYMVGSIDENTVRDEGQVWRCEVFRMDDELLSFFPKNTNSAPQGALSHLVAA